MRFFYTSVLEWGLVETVTSRLQSMRRRPTSGACSASLQNLAHHGSDFEKLLNVFHLIPYFRLGTTAHDGGAATGEGKCMGRPGPLISTRIDLPECLQQFDPAPFLCADSLAALFSPACLLMDDELLPPALPRGNWPDKRSFLSWENGGTRLGDANWLKFERWTRGMWETCFQCPRVGMLGRTMASIDKSLIAAVETHGSEGL